MTEESNNKKIWFIVIGYLILAILLILLFTLAKYTKNLDGETYIPQAQGFTATLALGDENGLSATVDDLLPGTTSAETMEFNVSNYQILSDETILLTESTLKYSVTVFTAGNLPLDLHLSILGDSNQVVATYEGLRMLNVSDTLGDGYQYTFYDENGLVAKFDMGNISEETEKFQLEFTWASDTTEIDTTTGYNTTMEYSAESYQKEIELIEIRAVIEAGVQ